MTLDDLATNAGLADGNTSWGNSWRGGWGALDTAVAGRMILAADHGWATGASAATNDAAIAAAIAAARTAGNLPVFLGIGTYHTSAPIDTGATTTNSTAPTLFGVSPRATTIVCDDNTADLIYHGGFRGGLYDFAIEHAGTDPDLTYGDGLVFRKSAWNRYERLRVDNCRRNIAVEQANVLDPGSGSGSSNWAFSNYHSLINVNRYSQSGLFLRAFGGRSTGSLWDVVYVENKTPGGAPRSSSGNPYPVDIFQVDEMTFNQLNIEDHAGIGIALLVNSGGVTTFNGLHFERVTLDSFNSQFLRAFGDAMAVVNGFSVSFCDVAGPNATGHSRMASAESGGRVQINGANVNNLSKTTAIPWYRVAAGNGDDSSIEYTYEVELLAGTPVTFDGDSDNTTDDGLKRVGDSLYGLVIA